MYRKLNKKGRRRRRNTAVILLFIMQVTIEGKEGRRNLLRLFGSER